MKTGVLSAQKNEAPFLVEFVSHHLAVGFDKVFVVTNPSSDYTNELAESLSAAGFIDHLLCAAPPGSKPQHHSLSIACSHFDISSLDWLIVLDADELLNIHIGDGRVLDLVHSVSQLADLISINMATFGNFPHSAWTNENSSTRFQYRFKPEVGWSGQGKTMIRNPKIFRGFLPHGPINCTLDRPLKLVKGAGLHTLDVSTSENQHYECLRNPGAKSDSFSFAQVNHYATRTLDSFQKRSARGDGAKVSNSENKYTPSYFSSIAQARFYDDSILRYRRRVNDVRERILSVDSIKKQYLNVIQAYAASIDFQN